MNAEFLRKFVPLNYQTQIRSAYKFSKCELLSSDTSELDSVICTSMGHLIELKNKTSIKSCELSSKEAKEIKPMFLYGYGSRIDIFYVVEFSNKQLEIVARTSSTLKSIRVEKNVSEWEISDSLNIGYPQLRVKHRNGIWQNISLQGDNYEMLPEGPQDVLIPFKNALKVLYTRLQHSKNLLTAKCHIRSQTTTELYPDASKPVPILVRSHNYVLHHGRIISATKLLQTSSGNVSNLKLIVMSRSQPGLRLQQQSPLPVLVKGTEICLVGAISISEPLPSLSSAISYSYSEDGNHHHVISLPSKELTTQNLLRDEFKIQMLDIEDMCQVLEHCSGSTKHLQICCSQTDVMENMALIISNFMNRSAFTMLSERDQTSVWVYSGRAVELHGSYLILQNKANSILLCCRDNSQLVLFYNLIISHEMIKELRLAPFHPREKFIEKSNPQNGLKALEHELNWLSHQCSVLNKTFTVENYRIFYEELMNRSAATDSNFVSNTYESM